MNDGPMLDPAALGRFKEVILAEYPRLSLDDTFRFRCHRDLECFNSCCADVNVFLLPYDVLRLKRALGLDSRTFLDRYTYAVTLDERGLGAVLIRMTEDERKRCPFVGAEGCTVYADRPWSCRMYPIGSAAPPAAATLQPGACAAAQAASGEEPFYFVVERFPTCLGFDEPTEWTVRGWKADQGVGEYEAKGEAFRAICQNRFFRERKCLEPEKARMLHMACYDLDTFRRFVFDSTFLRRFDVEPALVERMREDDEALLIFAYRWIRFSLFGEKTLAVTDAAVEEGIQKMGRMFTR